MRSYRMEFPEQSICPLFANKLEEIFCTRDIRAAALFGANQFRGDIEVNFRPSQRNFTNVAKLRGVESVQIGKIPAEGYLRKKADQLTILINSELSKESQNFVFAHEIGHTYFWNYRVENHTSPAYTSFAKAEEWFCDLYAGAFMLPRDFLDENLPNKTTLNLTSNLSNYAKRLGVSPSILLTSLDVHGWLKVSAKKPSD